MSGSLGRLALALGAPLVLFGILEFGAWVADVELLAENTRFKRRMEIQSCRHRQVCMPIPSSGRQDVVVYGGSSVAGHKIRPGTRFSDFTARVLNERRPGEFSVRNLGSPCKESGFVRRCVERTIEAQPRVLVLYTGHNDFAWFLSPSPRVEMWRMDWGGWIFELQRLLAKTHVYSLLATDLKLPLVAPHERAFSMSPEEVESAVDVILTRVLANLTRVIELAGEDGAEVILVTVVSNLHEFPIERSGWVSLRNKKKFANESLRIWARQYVKGIELYEAGEFKEATMAFKRARDVNLRGRAPARLNAALRTLAAAHPHVHLVDFEADLDRVGAREGIGCNFFGNENYCDGVHLNERANRLLGQRIAQKIIQQVPEWSEDRGRAQGTSGH